MADALALETMPLRSSQDVVRARQRVRDIAVGMGFSLVEQTKLVTAASELARNTIEYGRGGDMTIERIDAPGVPGIRLVFSDQGPGIPDIELALRDGYTTGGGLGMGLGGARRLVSEMTIDSTPGAGTRITVTKWKRA
ncbi:MAG TPA: anti-sigma regulatory factor [Candidatus Limnocylindrales bacterium]|nr:anti-sigma regulatory factor [Candidatus Limnocylindrales bacterium]